MWTERDRPEPDHQKQFHAAVSVIQSLPKNGSYRASYEEMLRFYSYYKQATQGPCHMPRPGFWDPIGRYKWDAWHRLGRMSQKEAMAAYITEMKVVAQKVIDTVPLSEVDDGMFNYFVPLYEMIPDMPQPPEVFLKKLTARKEKIPNGDMKMAFDPLPPPEEPAPQTSGAQLPRVPSIHGRASMDLDTEIFCDSLEQLEPEQGEWLQEELKESLVGEPDVSSDHLLSRERGDSSPASLTCLPSGIFSLSCIPVPVLPLVWGWVKVQGWQFYLEGAGQGTGSSASCPGLPQKQLPLTLRATGERGRRWGWPKSLPFPVRPPRVPPLGTAAQPLEPFPPRQEFLTLLVLVSSLLWP
uniref:ACB domain-containing protein n=1 Tax=Monodelphis domestica TaxID=13616 RepID=F6ZAG0_MONDO